MYATKRRRRTVKSVKTPSKDPPKSNPSKRHRERLNGELEHLASLLPFEQSVISKLDKLSILRLAVSYLRTKTYFQVLPDGYNHDGHHRHLLTRSQLYPEPGFSEGDSILQALYGFLFVVTCDGEVFFASRTVEQYLGFHQSDIIHQSVMELIHSEDRDEFKRQLTWNSTLPQDKANITLHEAMMSDNYQYLHRSFTVRFRCLLDNTSGFITLEVNGWIRVLHGQNIHSEEPQLALFATCCPFGPLSLLDLPSRELTFKSKHKMDFSPISMDNRGKMMFGFSDRELATKSGYDLIHPDDLSYFAAAHQELIKTGSSGLIAYRWLTKDFRWLWLQSSCKVIYKNSKPDFVICTHRQLTDDEGQDLFHKRGNEFKLPYPLLDLDICSGFDFANDDLIIKMKNGKNKKQKGQIREYLQTGRKKKGNRDSLNGFTGYGPYPPLNGYENGEFKPEFIYPYSSNNFGIEPDIYRSHAYSSFPGSVYPASDTYRLETDKHSYSNGYYIDPHRQYQHTLSYHGSGYTDLMASTSKYGYDVAKYGFDGYSLDLAKKMHYTDDYSRLDKYGYDYGGERLAPRLNGSLEPMDLRSPSMYGGPHLMNGVDTSVPPASCLSTSTLFKSDIVSGQNPLSKDTKVIRSTSDSMQSQAMNASLPLQHSSVIKNITSARVQNTQNSNKDHINSPTSNGYGQQVRGNVINSVSTHWNSCVKSVHPSPISTPHSDHGGSPTQKSTLTQLEVTGDTNSRQIGSDISQSNILQTSSPVTGATPTSVIHTAAGMNKIISGTCDKQPLVGGIPVPVVKSPWIHQYPATHNTYTELKDWHLPSSDMYACHQKLQRGVLADMTHPSKVTIP